MPGHWDISAAGQIDLGETPLDAGVRETLEELGIKIDGNKLYYIFSRRTFNKVYELLQNVFLYKYDGDDDFVFNDGETSEVRWVALDYLKKWSGGEITDEKLVSHGDVYYSQLFAHVERLAARENA